MSKWAKRRRAGNKAISQAVCEYLERRTLLSAYIVTTASDDDGSGAPTATADANVFDVATLRDAVTAVNAAGGTNTISFDPTAFSTLQTITLTDGQLELSSVGGDTTIDGPGSGLLSISGNGAGRVFQIDQGVSATLSGMNITGGMVQGSTGSISTANAGGGIFNAGTLTLQASTITSNNATYGGGIYSSGTMSISYSSVQGNYGTYDGGVCNLGTMTISSSVLSSNTSGPGDAELVGSVGVSAGGIANFGTLSLVNSTLNGDGGGQAGAVFSDGYLIVFDSTISGNTSTAAGAGIYAGATAALYGNIIAGNTGAAGEDDLDAGIDGAFQGMRNLIGVDNTGTFTNDDSGGDQVGVDPMLGPLQDNGGPTETMALLTGSPAIGANMTFTVDGVPITTDQRGVTRPPAAPDIGAYEFSVNTTPTVTTLATSSSSIGLGDAVTLTATVTSTTGSPGGTVTFLDGTTTLGMASVNTVTNQAILVTTDLTLGSNGVEADYGAGEGYAASASQPVDVTAGATSTTLAASTNAALYGQSVTLTATVTATSGSPAGTVTFVDGSTTLGSAAVNSNEAILVVPSGDIAALALGSHDITATFGTTDQFLSSLSTLVNVMVSPIPTTTSLGSSTLSALYGQNVTLTATVNSTTGSPAGTVTFVDGSTTLGSAAVNSNEAILVVPSGDIAALALGSHVFTATFSGGDEFVSSTSTSVTVMVSPIPTTTTLASSTLSAAYGQNVTLTATVNSTSGSPAGMVTFLDGSTTLGTAAVNTNKAVLILPGASVPALGGGVNSITAVFGAANGFATSTSTSTSVTITPAATTTTLATSNTSAVYSQKVTLTATVSSTTASPAGSVTFLDGTTTLGTAAVNTNKAILVLPASGMTLPVGSDSITAVFGANADFTASTSAPVKVTVTVASTTTTITSSTTATGFGQPVTLTATVSSLGSPSGSVTFKNGSTTIGTMTLTSGSNEVMLVTTTLPVGTGKITAVYAGVSNEFSSSTSAALSVTITPQATTTTLGTSANPTTFGQTVTLTATVLASVGTPSGTVAFVNGTTTLGTAAINTFTGKAVLSETAKIVGTNNLTAVYLGTNGYSISKSAVLAEVVDAEQTTTTLIPSVNPGVFGKVVTLTAHVSADFGTPPGSVVFLNGTSTLGKESVNTSSGLATFSGSTWSVGTDNLTAVYLSSTSSFTGSTSPVVAESIAQASSTNALSASTTSPLFGQTVTLTATVSSTAGSPGGTVTFLDGTTTLGVGAVNTSSHKATLTTSALSLGSNNLTAVYGGATDYTQSTSTALGLTVKANPTTTKLSVSPSSAVFDQPVTLTATVTSSAGSPSGSVTFLDGATTLGVATVNTTSHTAVLTTLPSPGSNSLTAVYSGVTGYATSTSSSSNETINADATTTTLAASVTNPSAGALETFTATVTAPFGSPGGTVTFKDGTVILGTEAVNTSTKQAGLSTTALPAGSDSITATYNGTTGYAASTSAALKETVGGSSTSSKTTSTSLTFSTSNASVGQVVTFTATVTGSSGTPTGSVTFTCGGTTIGTVSLNGSGKASVSEAATFNNITATYSGDSAHAGSTTSATLGGALTAPTNLSGGLQYGILTPGTGAVAQSGQLVEVNYTGYLLTNGSKFDSSLNAGRTPFLFGIGENSVIQGWEEGVPGMKVGETRVLVIPPSLGYKSTPQMNGSVVTIPANSTLVFTVQLLAVNVPRLQVVDTGNATQLAVNQTPSTGTGTSFGTTKVGAAGSVSSFQLNTNDSSFNLSLSGNPFVQLTGADTSDFILTQPSSANGFVFTIQFKPKATGTRTATINIPSNDPDAPNFTFTITGVGD